MREQITPETWFDERIEELARQSGARELRAPATIPADVLARCEHFESFPGMAIAAGPDLYHAPAACYHVYAALQGARVHAGELVTLVAPCARNEPGADLEPGRLTHFRMREVVFLGPPAWVTRQRDEWMQCAATFAAALGVDGRMEGAADTFFGNPGRGRRLIQQLKTLKFELRADVEARPLALASFNLHETFFTKRFDIAMADGSLAASGCAAFGLARWALAHTAARHASL
jgi:seryl-tRNA synthetase